MDEGARKHIRLLLDPCNAPLVRPAYEASAGGLLVRYRRVINVGTEVGKTAFAVGFLPHENVYHIISEASDTTINTWSNAEVFTGLDQVAGGSTLSFRCVAACIKGLVLASELNRAGVVCAGSVESDTVIPTNSAQTTSVATIQGILPFSTRAPEKSIEVLWTPSENSAFYRASDVTPSLFAGTHDNACVLTASGLPAATGMRLEFTAVYELRPANSSNVVAVVEPPPSSNTWNQILREYISLAGNRVRMEAMNAAYAGASYLGQAMAARMAGGQGGLRRIEL